MSKTLRKRTEVRREQESVLRSLVQGCRVSEVYSKGVAELLKGCEQKKGIYVNQCHDLSEDREEELVLEDRHYNII